MAHAISEHGDYLRGVIGDEASVDEFVAFYRELQRRCSEHGCNRALVVVTPESQMPGPERLHTYARAGFTHGFKLALVCAAWTLYQACNDAERAAAATANINMRAFFHEMEALRWLTG